MATKRLESGLLISSDGRWYSFRPRDEIPELILSWKYPHLKTEKGFIYWKRNFYHLSDFAKLVGVPGWDVSLPSNVASGVLLKLSKDGKKYTIATYHQPRAA